MHATLLLAAALLNASAAGRADPPAPPPQPASSPLERLAQISIDGAEVLALDPDQPALLVTAKAGVHRIDLAAWPDLKADPAWTFKAPRGSSISHVEVDPARRGFAAATVIPGDFAVAPGSVVIFDPSSGEVFASISVGHNPDCCKFSPDGARLIVANEGQPELAKNAIVSDPPGSISIIDLAGVKSPADLGILGSQTRDFNGPVLTALAENPLLRIHPRYADDPAIDLEPEYIAVHGDTAWITLQENNAVARINLASSQLEAIHHLAWIDQRLDASDRDGGIHIRSTIAAMPMPDQIAAVTIDGRCYLITANEGDDRGDLGESPLADVDRLGNLHKAGRLAPDAVSDVDLAADRLGRLKVCTHSGDSDQDGLIDRPALPGSRSLSIWDAQTLQLVADTGAAFETLIAQTLPVLFNTDDNAEEVDSRSDARGPEPEGLAVLTTGQTTLAFVTLERPGAIAVVDISHPRAPAVIGLHPSASEGDTGPEGIIVFDGAILGLDHPIVAAAYEASGTVALYRVKPR